ncbi:MAG: Methyl-accepting chemotaxis protein CtpH [Pelotomaculum sp. PtaU1.Bin035]|nr:MAG: Methyl-accepting chemotaxis protein CtpH [Pelotomaculum sp. PtaU1.Bin035]
MKFKRIFEINRLRISVATKIAIALSLLISFLMAAIGTSVFLRDQAIFKRQLEEKGWNIVHTALQFSGNYMQAGNTELLNNLVKTVGTFQDISYVMVLDAGGKVLAHTDDKQTGSKMNDEVTRNALALKANVMKICNDEQGKPAVMDFYAPINTAGATTGYLRLGVDLTGLNKHARETVINIILICLAAIMAGIFLAALISKRILKKPLRALTAATEKLATGDFSYKVPVYMKDELGDLASAFNTMSVHLSNLIQSVKSSAVDINKSAEQILGRLQTSDRTNNRLSQTFNLLKQSTEEQVSILKQSISLSGQLSDQSKQAMDSILQILNEVNKTFRMGENGVSAIAKIAANIKESGQSLENTNNSLKQLENKGRQFGKNIDYFSNLLKKNTACTVQVALQAARSGNEELTRAAEELHNISEDSSRRIKQMSQELEDVQNTWKEAETALGGNMKRLTDGQEAVREAGESLEKVLQSLLQSKGIIEEIASAAHRQSANIEDIRQGQSGIIDALLKSINKSSGAGNDTKLQMESLHDINSLAKKLMRMVDRLNVLSLQFKV